MEADRSQHPSMPESVENTYLHGRTLRDWHRALVTSSAGEPLGHLRTPASRYGRDAHDCAWWAIAAETVLVDFGSDPEDETDQEALEYLMGLAVNDDQSILDIVRENWGTVPAPLREHLDYYENKLNMNQQVALINICNRYGVEYNAQHYSVSPSNSWMMARWAEGWVGGVQSTIYVGVDPEGGIYS